MKSGMDSIRIQLEGLGHALSDRFLGVPSHQRSYAWERQHILDLFQDLASAIDAREPEYFLGTVVVSKRQDGPPDVLDGQQRLATTTILLAAIRDYFLREQDGGRAQDIERKYLLERNLRSQEMTPKLRLNLTDNDFFSKLILSQPSSPDRHIRPERDSHNRLLMAAQLASQHVESLIKVTNTPVDRLLDWVEFIDNRARVIWVEVPDDMNAFRIFETLNDRGLDLSITDLLKNYLFSLSGDRLEEIQQHWAMMTGSLETVVSEPMIKTYVRHLWSSKYGLTREKELYENIRKQVTSKQKSVDLARDLSASSALYAALLYSEHEFWAEYGTITKIQLQVLHLLRLEQFRPMMLAALRHLPRPEIQKLISMLVSWSVRFLIVGGLGSGTLERYFSDAGKLVSEGTIKSAIGVLDHLRSVIPSDRTFQDAFERARVSQSYLARYYLRALERKATGEDQAAFVPNPDEADVNLEHVLPERTLGSGWLDVPIDIAADYFKRLGNMVLLTSRINEAAGNKGFAAKVDHYRNSEFLLTRAVAEFAKWGPSEIDSRQRDLAALAVKTWPLAP